MWLSGSYGCHSRWGRGDDHSRRGDGSGKGILLMQLNERHYGALQGLNKCDSAEKYGLEQVQKWRRCYAVRHPALVNADFSHQRSDPQYADLKPLRHYYLSIFVGCTLLFATTSLVAAEDCVLYVGVQERCFPWRPLSQAVITSTNQDNNNKFINITDRSGNCAVILPEARGYSVEIKAGGYTTTTLTTRNHCKAVQATLDFYMFLAGTTACPVYVQPPRLPDSVGV